MPEQWIVRVQGQEYGPADLETLREWRDEGRLLPANQARPVDVDLWTKAAEIPGLFRSADVAAAEPGLSPSNGSAAGRLPQARLQPHRRSVAQILTETLRIYRKGFFQFLCLTLLVALPSICAQLSGAALGASPEMNADLRTLIAAMFTFCMLLLSLAAWPAFIAGIQIVTAEIAAGRKARIFIPIYQVVKFWPRVAMLCILVYGAYFFWTVLPLAIIWMIMSGPLSLLSTFLVLVVLAFQVWIVGRLFVNFLFWQQFAVLAESDAASALRQSKNLARSGHELPWFRRPLWRGVLLFSIWSAFVLAINVGPEWPSIRHYFHQLTTSQDPQALLQAITTSSKSQAFNLASFILGLVQMLLRPLLGIAFVLLYFDSQADFPEGNIDNN
jgi:hypothetical protein